MAVALEGARWLAGAGAGEFVMHLIANCESRKSKITKREQTNKPSDDTDDYAGPADAHLIATPSRPEP
jgi:hypothetical protein